MALATVAVAVTVLFQVKQLAVHGTLPRAYDTPSVLRKYKIHAACLSRRAGHRKRSNIRLQATGKNTANKQKIGTATKTAQTIRPQAPSCPRKGLWVRCQTSAL